MTDPPVWIARRAQPGGPGTGPHRSVARRWVSSPAPPRAGPGRLDGAGGVEAGCLRSRAAAGPAALAGGFLDNLKDAAPDCHTLRKRPASCQFSR